MSVTRSQFAAAHSTLNFAEYAEKVKVIMAERGLRHHRADWDSQIVVRMDGTAATAEELNSLSEALSVLHEQVWPRAPKMVASYVVPRDKSDSPAMKKYYFAEFEDLKVDDLNELTDSAMEDALKQTAQVYEETQARLGHLERELTLNEQLELTTARVNYTTTRDLIESKKHLDKIKEESNGNN